VDRRRGQVICRQYREDRARQTLRDGGKQVTKAGKAVAGKTPVKGKRFIQLSDDIKSVNRELEAAARTLAGLNSYITNLAVCSAGAPGIPQFVIGSYYQLFQIEKSFRISKRNL
jgi:hypothetical protein